jgi:ferrous iron transport protein A
MLLGLMRLSFSSFGSLMPDILPLHLLPAGQCAHIDQLVGGPDEVHRLQELGMRVGSPIEMLQRGSPCIIRLDGARLAFRQHDGCRVLVRLGAAG